MYLLLTYLNKFKSAFELQISFLHFQKDFLFDLHKGNTHTYFIYLYKCIATDDTSVQPYP